MIKARSRSGGWLAVPARSSAALSRGGCWRSRNRSFRLFGICSIPFRCLFHSFLLYSIHPFHSIPFHSIASA